MADVLIRQHRMMRCEKCGEIFKLAHRAAGEEVDGTLRLAMPTPCPNCGHVAKHPVAGGPGWAGKGNAHLGGRPADKADRIQSTMRYDPDLHKWLDDLSHQSGLSVADLVNEFVRWFQTNKAMTDEVIGWLKEAKD